ncbi:MAG TPA: hypothetical protein PLH12_09850 [Pseudomonadales bacterium]|nr:hypothetical protein [Pseudomonadales bacterium]
MNSAKKIAFFVSLLSFGDAVNAAPAQVVDHIGKYQEAGAYRLMLMWQDQNDLDGIELLAKEVLPHFHKSG